jgi:glycine reductase
MVPVALQKGVGRVVTGVRIEHTLGDPALPAESDRKLRKEIITRALKALETNVKEPTLFS